MPVTQAPTAFTREDREMAKRQALHLRAKGEFAASLSVRGITVAAGWVLPSVLPGNPYVPAALVLGLVIAEYLGHRSDTTKGVSEQVARAVDYHNALGWPLKEGPRLAGAALVSPERIETIARQQRAAKARYFDSPVPPGPGRAVQNVKQSAWYTADQMGGLQQLMWGLVVLSVLIAAVYFFYALQPLVGVQDSGADAAFVGVIKASSTLVTAALSLGLVRLAVSYGRAHQSAQRHHQMALDYEKLGDQLQERDGIFLLASYHAARASMPLIPEWWWDKQKKRLNRIWESENAT